MSILLLIVFLAMMIIAGQFIKKRHPLSTADAEFIAEKRELFSDTEKTWWDRFNALPDEKKICRFSLFGMAENKICDNAFMCSSCEFAKKFMPPELVTRKSYGEAQQVAGIEIPGSIFLHRGHTWVRIDNDGNAIVGVDDFARRLMGRISHVNVSIPGTILEQGETALILEKDGAKTPVLSPMDGRIITVNREVLEKPELIHNEPYSRGWLFKIKPYNLYANLRSLLTGIEAKLWMKSELESLRNLLQDNKEVAMAADGGTMVEDLSDAIKEQWEEVTRSVMLSI